MSEKVEESLAKLEAQREFCKKNEYPHFARDHCHVCGHSWTERYTLEQAGKSHITNCPFCHWAWND